MSDSGSATIIEHPSLVLQRLDPIDIVLTKYEMQLSALCGVWRQIEKINTPDAYGFKEEFGWNVHIEGAGGEQSGAKATGRYWEPTVNTYRAPDVTGGGFQVRTRSRHDYQLIVRPEAPGKKADDPDDIYLHVTGKAPRFRVWGYIRGRDAQRDEWKRTYGDRPWAWFVPLSALLPWRDLCVPPISIPRRKLIRGD